MGQFRSMKDMNSEDTINGQLYAKGESGDVFEKNSMDRKYIVFIMGKDTPKPDQGYLLVAIPFKVSI